MRIVSPSTGISTKRTLLRPLHLGDLSSIQELHSDDLTRKYAWVENLQSTEDNFNWLQDQVLQNQNGMGLYAIESLSAGQFIGLCGLRTRQDMDGIIDISYRVLPQFRQLGFATEAARMMIKHGFEHLHMSIIYAQVHKDNFPSRRIMYRLGFEAIDESKSWILYSKLREHS